MRLSRTSRLWLSFLLHMSSASEDQSATQPPNPNHIFNAIHSSMRQWGSSLHHNGMSMFLATVPRGSQLYHGTCSSAPVNGMEWLAFEPEHAGVFTRCRRGPLPGGPPHEHPPLKGPTADVSLSGDRDSSKISPDGSHGESVSGSSVDRPHAEFVRSERVGRNVQPQQILFQPEQESLEEGDGYLHTYTTKHDLRLLYLDGQSAAKSLIGTLDIQDIVLLHSNPPSSINHEETLNQSGEPGRTPENRRPNRLMGEYARATGLCNLARNEWKGRIDGVIRMEVGFEIILCSFEQHLAVDRIGKISHAFEALGSIENFQAIASRFDGIGGRRVTINTENFVTLFSDPAAVYFDERGMPRARNETAAMESVQRAVKDLVLNEDVSGSYDWQPLTDMVIARYSDRIEALASGDMQDLEAFKIKIESAMRPFIDYAARNRSIEIQRCAIQHFQRPPDSASLAATAIFNVTATLCTALTDASEAKSLDDALAIVRRLKEWLSWTTWKRCRGCAYNEACFIPIWPLGGKEDMEHPRCITNMSETSHGYWDSFDRPPRE